MLPWWTPAEFYVNLWVLMHWYTCKSLLNTLQSAVEQLAVCLSKQNIAVEAKVQQSCKASTKRFFLCWTKNHSNSMYSPIAEASIKDLETKNNKAMVHTEKSYKANVLRLPLKEVIESIKTISWLRLWSSLWYWRCDSRDGSSCGRLVLWLGPSLGGNLNCKVLDTLP